MTREDRLLYKAGEKPSTLGKYGPSATRDIEFVSKGGLDRPSVTVKQKKNGQYVVVEKLPARNFQHRNKFSTVEQSLAETGVNFRSLKPSWKYWAKKNEVESAPAATKKQSYRPGRYPRSLPPIDLGWKAEPLVGSLLNSEHQPGGGDIKIKNEKIKWQAKAKVGSLDNVDYNRTRSSQSDPSNERLGKLRPSPRYGALASVGGYSSHYTPGGAEVVANKAPNPKYDHVQSKVGSLENASHVPAGGDITIQNHRLRWKRESLVGSLDNVHHQPQGGDIYIVNQRLTWQAKPRVGSLENINHIPQTTLGKVPSYKTSWDGRPRVGSLDNIHHTPRGGNVVITSRKLRWKAESKIGSLPPKRASMEDLSIHSDNY